MTLVAARLARKVLDAGAPLQICEQCQSNEPAWPAHGKWRAVCDRPTACVGEGQGEASCVSSQPICGSPGGRWRPQGERQPASRHLSLREAVPSTSRGALPLAWGGLSSAAAREEKQNACVAAGASFWR